MTTAYTSLLGLALPVDGELTGTWGQTVNNYITTYLDGAVAGTQIISGTQTAVTLSKTTGTSLSQAGTGATGSSQYQIIRCTGNPASLLTITVPAADKTYVVINATSTSQSVKIVGAGPTTGVTITSGSKAIVAWDGSDFVEVSPGTVTSVAATVPSFLSVSGSPITSSGTLAISLSGTALPVANGGTGSTSTTYCSLSTNVSGTLPVANGGTGATTAATARTNLGATTVGANVLTLTNPSAITFPQFNADNTVSALDAASFRTAIGAGSGTGTVTSVSVTSANGFAGTVANPSSTPAITLTTSISGMLKGSASALVAATSGTDFSAGTSALATGILKSTTTTGALTIAVAADFPLLNQSTTGTAAGLSATLAIASGGTNSTATPTAGGAGYGTGTAHAYTAAGTAGQVLTSAGAGAPTWSGINGGTF